MKNYMKYDFNNKITLLVLLASGLPPYKHYKNVPNETKNVANFDMSDIGYDEDLYHFYEGHVTDKDDNDFAVKFNSDGLKNNMTPSDRRIVEFIIAMELNMINDPDVSDSKASMDHYQAKYIALTNHIIIYDKKNDITYLVYKLNDNGSTADSFDYKVFTQHHAYNQVLVNELYAISKHKLGESTTPIDALRNLWVAQAIKYKINPTRTKKQIKHQHNIPKDAKKLFLQIMVGTNINKHTSKDYLSITYQDMIDFYHEVRSGHLTNKTRRVQDWIFKANSVNGSNAKNKNTIHTLSDLLNMLQLRSNYHNVMNGIKEVSPSSNFVNNLKKQFHRNFHYKHYGFHLQNVYKLGYPQKQIPGKYKFVGLHGTNSFSVPSILFSSLCNGAELDKLNKKHGKVTDFKYTAEAFGPGVYFAALHDSKPHRHRSGDRDTCGITKSLNYSNSHSDKYKMVFIATSTYNDPIHVGTYAGNIGNHDWLFSKDVGGSESLSEAVTKSSKQIHLDYLCVFRNNHK